MASGWRHPDGTYEGDVNPDTLIPHGLGTYYYKNGDEYEGNFNTSKRQGFGVMKYANGDRFEGDFHHNLAQGPGRYEFANGDVHVGNYFRGKRHGRGRLVYHNGDEYEGRFRKGQKRDNNAIYKYSNGDIYYGKFKEDKPFGRGKLKVHYRDKVWNEETEEYDDGEKYHKVLDVWNGKLLEVDHKGNYLNFDPMQDVDELDSETTESSAGSESGGESATSLTTPLTLSRAGSPTLELEKTRPYSPGASLADALSAASLEDLDSRDPGAEEGSLASAASRRFRK